MSVQKSKGVTHTNAIKGQLKYDQLPPISAVNYSVIKFQWIKYNPISM